MRLSAGGKIGAFSARFEKRRSRIQSLMDLELRRFNKKGKKLRSQINTRQEEQKKVPFFSLLSLPGLPQNSPVSHSLCAEMASVPLPTASSRTAAIARTPSSAVATASKPRATPNARAVNAPPTAPAPPSSSPSRREPPSLQGSDADKLREGIATFYDESSQLWEDVW